MNVDKSQILQDYSSGLSVRKVAENHGIGSSTVYRILKENGINRNIVDSWKKRGSVVLNEQEVCKRYLSGESVNLLSSEYSVSRNKIQKILNNHKIKKKRNRKVVKLNHQICSGDYSIANIMKTHSVSKSTAIKLRALDKITDKACVIDLPMDQITDMHLNHKMSASEISDRFGVYYGTIINKLGDLYNPSFNNGIENKIKDLLESIGVSFSQNIRTIISPFELDFYISDYNLAIEVNGIYWHTELSGNKNKHYHKKKYQLCAEHGIQLLQFTDDDIKNRFEIVRSMIISRCGQANRIFARKCEFKSIALNDAKEFMNSNHLSGYTKASFAYGLYHDDELIQCMTISKNRFERDGSVEIVRFSTRLNYIVVGGLSKILSKIPYTKITTYSNNDHGNGNSYLRAGFIFIGETRPGYSYVKNGKLFSRMSFQKYKLRKKLEKFEESLSEWENMKANGYDRLWNSGNKKFKLNK